VSSTIEQGFARIVAARQRVIDVRAERNEELLRLRAFLRTTLGDCASTVDPLSGARVAEVMAEGSKAGGDLSLTLAFFDGTKLRIAVDAHGRFEVNTTPAHLFPYDRVFDVRVAPDGSRAEIEALAPDAQTRRTEDVAALLGRVLEHAARAIEAEMDPMPPQAGAATAAA
jgi:hypothetical protein